MQTRKALMATASLAIMACVTGSVSAQNSGARNAGPAAARTRQRSSPIRARPRHLLYIATPGDEGADDQSGVVVLDADHDYRFVKRIPYGLAASELPGPEDLRHDLQHSGQQDLCHHRWRQHDRLRPEDRQDRLDLQGREERR